MLPPKVAAAVDWSKLRTAPDRLIGARLQPHVPDLVFTAARTDADEPVVLLIEHKSYPDAEVERQLLRYAVLLQHHLRRRGVAPALVAVVLRHGTPANVAKRVPGGDPLEPWQPHLPFVLDDLTHRDEQRLAERQLTPLAHLTLLCLMQLVHLDAEQVPSAFERWGSLLRAVDGADATPHVPPHGSDAVDAIGWYALAVTEVAPRELVETFGRILGREADTIMSTLERIYREARAEGRAEGRSEGERDGRVATLLRLLHRRFGPLPADVPERVRAATTEQLEQWTDRVLDIASVDELLRG